jgi:hypothetical protein
MFVFSNQKSEFGYILEGLGMEKVSIFFGYFEFITAVWYIFWPLGNLVAIWYLFLRFGILCQEKSGNPGYRHLCLAFENVGRALFWAKSGNLHRKPKNRYFDFQRNNAKGSGS